jgi:hypothetical protein
MTSEMKLVTVTIDRKTSEIKNVVVREDISLDADQFYTQLAKILGDMYLESQKRND